MKIEELISEMQQVKANHPSLELQDILRMFNILALQNLAKDIRRMKW